MVPRCCVDYADPGVEHDAMEDDHADGVSYPSGELPVLTGSSIFLSLSMALWYL